MIRLHSRYFDMTYQITHRCINDSCVPFRPAIGLALSLLTGTPGIEPSSLIKSTCVFTALTSQNICCATGPFIMTEAVPVSAKLTRITAEGLKELTWEGRISQNNLQIQTLYRRYVKPELLLQSYSVRYINGFAWVSLPLVMFVWCRDIKIHLWK